MREVLSLLWLVARTLSSTRRKGDMDISLVFKIILGFIILFLLFMFVTFVSQRGKEKIAGFLGVVFD